MNYPGLIAKSAHGGRAGMVPPIYFTSDRNPYVFCPHHIGMCMVTEIRRPSD